MALVMQLSMHKRVQYDSVKGEMEVALCAALEGASKISFSREYLNLKLYKKLMVFCQCN